MSRYARQEILPEVGAAGQERLRRAHVVVIGAGGLGAPALQYLAAAGVGTLGVIDDDVVENANLQRQVIHRDGDIGTPKVTAAARALAARNSACTVVAHPVTLGPDTVAKLCHDATLVLDCADSFAASYVLSDHCLNAGLPLISASALEFGGYVGGFCGGAPSLRAVFPDLPDRAASCDTAGVMGPVVATIGAAQAQMALACLLGLSPSPLGQLISFDLASYRSGGFRFDTAPEPDHGFGFVAPSQIRASDWVVDLRGPDEGPTAATPTARRIPLPDRTTGRMGGRQPVRIEQQRDFLLRVIGKADHRLACAQIEMRGKAFQCGHCAAFTALVRGLDHHHSIGIHRPKHGAQSLRLLRTGDIVACRPPVIQQQLILIVEQTREPFNVIGRDPHYCALPDQVSHARLMSIMRFSAMAMASCGRPRATRASG